MTSLLDLIEAANFNNERIAELLIEEEANNNQHHQLGMTPVLEAAMFGLLSAVKAPLAAGVDANIRHGTDELTLLDVAAVMGHVEIVRTLLEHGVDVNDVSPAVGFTTLHRCVLNSTANTIFIEVLDLLVAAGADLDAPTTYGDTPLHLASQWRPSGFIATALLQRGATRDAASNIGTGRSPLDVAAQYGNIATVRVLLAAGADATARVDGVDGFSLNGFNNVSPLDVAAGYGKVEVIRELVRHGVDVNAACGDTGCAALHHAARMRQVGAVSALLDAGASITAQTIICRHTPLHLAASSLALETMLALLRRGAPVRALKDDGVNRKCDPPLHWAAQYGGTRGATEAVELLLKWGADVFEVDMKGKTVAEVIGDATMISNPAEIAMAKITHALLAAESSRCRRRVLLLCLARTRTVRKRRGESWGKGKRKEGEKGGEEEKGRGGEGGGGGSGDAVSSRADVGVSVEGGGRGKHQRTPSKPDGRQVRLGAGGGGSSVDGDGDRGGGGGGSGNGGDLDGVGAMLLELQKEDFFRALVMYL